MSEKEKKILETMAEVMPKMDEVQKARLEGVITGAAMVANKRQEKEGEIDGINEFLSTWQNRFA